MYSSTVQSIKLKLLLSSVLLSRVLLQGLISYVFYPTKVSWHFPKVSLNQLHLKVAAEVFILLNTRSSPCKFRCRAKFCLFPYALHCSAKMFTNILFTTANVVKLPHNLQRKTHTWVAKISLGRYYFRIQSEIETAVGQSTCESNC